MHIRLFMATGTKVYVLSVDMIPLMSTIFAAQVGGDPNLLLSTGAIAGTVVAIELTDLMSASPYFLSSAIKPSNASFA